MHFEWRLPVSARTCKEVKICQSHSCKKKPKKLRINNFRWTHQRTEITDHHSSNICKQVIVISVIYNNICKQIRFRQTQLRSTYLKLKLLDVETSWST